MQAIPLLAKTVQAIMSAKNFTAQKETPPASAATFPVIESRLAEQLGISRKLVALIRQEVLAPYVDWRLEQKEIRLTESAVQKIAAAYEALKKTPAAGAPLVLAQKIAPPCDAPALKVVEIDSLARQPSFAPVHPTIALTVINRCRTNPKIIYARAPYSEAHVTVRVQNSALWKAGMVIKCRLVAGNIYERVGRDPRFAGDQP